MGQSTKKENNTECGNYRSISLISHTGIVLLKVVAGRLGKYCERKGLLSEGQKNGFRPFRSTTASTAETSAEGRRSTLFLCFILIQNDYDFVDRNLLWQVLSRLGVPPQMTTVIGESHD